MSEDPKIVSRAELLEARAQLALDGKTIVQCHGCFDLVHPGHVRYLRYAKSLGDVLLVSVTSDRRISKGPDRPYIHQDLRMESLAALEFVDFVTLDDATAAADILEQVRPDIYVKGREYETSSDPRFLSEKQIVEGYGGSVVFSSGDVVFSSTRLLAGLNNLFGMEDERIRFFCKTYGIHQAALEETIGRFAGLRTVVIGDAILDRYVHCGDMRVATESPVVSVSPVSEDVYAGGAALIAGQMAALGAEVTLVTTLDDSTAAQQFEGLVADAGVELAALRTELRPVYVKTRYLVDDHKVFKVNEGQRAALSTDLVRQVTAKLEELAKQADLIVATDFGYGMFGTELIAHITELSRENDVPYCADVSSDGGANLLKFHGPALMAPTEAELRFAFGDMESGLSNLAARFYRETETDQLVLTMGARGAILFSRQASDNEPLLTDYLPAFNHRPTDDVGAGDVFLAVMSMARVCAARPQLGLYLASLMASLHIARLGNAPLGLAELLRALSSRPEL